MPAVNGRPQEIGRYWVETHYDWRVVYHGLYTIFPSTDSLKLD